MEYTDQQKTDKFMAHLQRAREIVKSWPKWKQEILGRPVEDTKQEKKEN